MRIPFVYTAPLGAGLAFAYFRLLSVPFSAAIIISLFDGSLYRAAGQNWNMTLVLGCFAIPGIMVLTGFLLRRYRATRYRIAQFQAWRARRRTVA